MTSTGFKFQLALTSFVLCPNFCFRLLQKGMFHRALKVVKKSKKDEKKDKEGKKEDKLQDVKKEETKSKKDKKQDKVDKDKVDKEVNDRVS